jgi:hypothetical protein
MLLQLIATASFLNSLDTKLIQPGRIGCFKSRRGVSNPAVEVRGSLPQLYYLKSGKG